MSLLWINKPISFLCPTPYTIPLPLQATTSGYRQRSGVQTFSWESKEAWSELVFTVDNSLFTRLASNSVYGVRLHRDNNHLKVRCETNIYSLYRGAAEIDLEILDENWPPLIGIVGGKVSPTTDLRGSGNNPDNSALTGSSLVWGKSCLKHWLLRILLCLVVASVS